MRMESLEWGIGQRDAHLWLTDDGRLIIAWGWVGDASHLCALRELEVVLDRRGATILITNGDAEDAEMRELWLEQGVDLIIVGDRTYRATRLKAGQGAAIVVFWDE